VDQEKTQPELGRSPETGASDQRPLQDEWGIFDPDQCGFSALVDKLDEVADSKEAPNRPVAMTRGILFQVSADERVVTGEQARHACSDRGDAMSSSGQQPATDPRRTSRSERGAALIEAAMTLPLLLLVCIGIIEFGRLYQTWQVMTNAAREGARIAVLPAPVNGGVDTRVREYLQMGGLKSDSSVGVNVAPADVSLGAGGTASGSRVTVTYPFSFMVLQPIAQLVVSGATAGAPITLTSSATMRNESQF
jgi:Flp pilus assembly protein TadG